MRRVEPSSGVQQGDAMGSALFCMPLLPALKRTRAEFKSRGVEAFAYLDDIIIGMMEITPDTVEVAPFFSSASCPTSALRSTRAKRLLCPRRRTYLLRNKSSFLKVLASASPNVEALRWLGCPSAQMNTRGRAQSR